jgi:hypothetical protein
LSDVDGKKIAFIGGNFEKGKKISHLKENQLHNHRNYFPAAAFFFASEISRSALASFSNSTALAFNRPSGVFDHLTNQIVELMINCHSIVPHHDRKASSSSR